MNIDSYTEGWLAAEEYEATGHDVPSHRSQGDTDWDKGWNAYIDWGSNASQKKSEVTRK